MANWALIVQSTKPTRCGRVLTYEALGAIAEACTLQLNVHYKSECGGALSRVRAVKSAGDVYSDEKPFYFLDALPDEPAASAYHLPGAAYCAVGTCDDLFGPKGVSVDASHEMLEDAGNPGANMVVDDGTGHCHARERCDAVETQSYELLHRSGQKVHVSNFLLDTWQVKNGLPPYTFMGKRAIKGAAEPKGAFQTAVSPDGSGNYQVIFPPLGPRGAVLGKGRPITSAMQVLKGYPRKRNGALHWSSRTARIIRAHQNKSLTVGSP